MRFTFVPVALLALSHSIIPGVHGAPSIASDHANSLAVRQGYLTRDLTSLVTSLLQAIPGEAVQVIQKLVQDLEQPVKDVVPRADPTFAVSSTTSDVSPTSTTQTSASMVGSASSVSSSTPQATPTFPVRMRRQLPSPIPSGAPNSLSTFPTSVLSGVLSKLGSMTLNPAASKPTTGN